MKQIDRIRNMNAEELAETISEHLICEKCDFWSCSGDKTKCAETYKAWLESEVTDE